MSGERAIYLGDAVYAVIESGMLRLTTDSHLPQDARNIIYLEQEVMEALVKFAKKEGVIK